MITWQRRLSRLVGSEKCFVCGLAGLTLLMHLVLISQISNLMLDEFWYVPEASRIARHWDGLGTVHPSLGKLFIAGGIRIFGFDPWGWRLPSIIFSVVSVIIFYLVCRELGGKRTAMFASLLFTFETLTFYYSGLGMLDAFSITFMLLSFLFYLRGRFVLSGTSLALGGLCKLPGLFGLLVIVGHWLMVGKDRDPRKVLLLSVIVVVTFFSLMPVTDFLASGKWLEPFHRFYYLAFQHVATGASDLPSDASAGVMYPWDWVLKPLSIDVHYSDDLWHKVLISPTLWALILPSMGYMLCEWVRNRRSIALFSLLWFAGTCLIWIPVTMVTGTYTYLFYFLPTVGAVCMAIGFGLNRLWELRGAESTGLARWVRVSVGVYLFLHVAGFLMLSPLITLVAPSVFVRNPP